MSGVGAFIEELPQSSLAPSACEDTVRRWLSEKKEAGPHQILELLVSSSWTS